jgi:hypothetical protein
MILNFGGPKIAITASIACIHVHSCTLALLAIALLRAKLGRSCSCLNVQYCESYKITITCFYMARDVMILMRAISITKAIGRGRP